MSDNKHIHEEHEMENSLTAPSDRDPSRSYKPNQGHPELTEDIALHKYFINLVNTSKN